MPPPLNITGPYMCLRTLLRSVRTKVQSKPVQRFLQRRILDSWRENRTVRDPLMQRALLDRAGVAIAVLQSEKKPKPETVKK